jgi:PAS domain S-box-containing protein
MTIDDDTPEEVEKLLAVPDLADALESERFKHFLDQIPIAIVVSEIKGEERIAYVNPEFEKLSGQVAADVEGKLWTSLHGVACGDEGRKLGEVIVELNDFVGTFDIQRDASDVPHVDVYSNVIVDENGVPAFRLAALVEVGAHRQEQREELEQQLRDKDMLLQEIQHRVKNNLQMITALLRIEARNVQGRMDTAPFRRLAGRIDAIQLIYKLLSEHGQSDEIDLGIYLSEIVSSAMHAHAVEGVHLDLKVDSYPVSVNVAMPTGLVLNELLTNAFKHAFKDRSGGTITVHSLADEYGCRVTVADDGVGLPEGVEWPQRGKLSALIVRSLRENAKADLRVESSPENGTRVTIVFTRAAAAPSAG